MCDSPLRQWQRPDDWSHHHCPQGGRQQDTGGRRRARGQAQAPDVECATSLNCPWKMDHFDFFHVAAMSCYTQDAGSDRCTVHIDGLAPAFSSAESGRGGEAGSRKGGARSPRGLFLSLRCSLFHSRCYHRVFSSGSTSVIYLPLSAVNVTRGL